MSNTPVPLDPFFLIGIATRTTNEGGNAAEDLEKLWGRFYSENIPGRIPNALGPEVYSVYTDYASDYEGEYTTVIGLRVANLDEIPDGMVGREFGEGKYQKFVAKGPLPQAVMQQWQEIWQKDGELNRAYTADFEVYGPNSQNGDESEVEIFIAIA